MQITIAAIGKSTNSPEESIASDYLKRLKWKCEWAINDGRKLKNKAEETGWLLQVTQKAEKIIALDEHGKELNSVEFAHLLAGFSNDGVKHLAFIIGGADGLDKSQLPKHAQTLCFGRMTWPHMMVRAMLAEQLYRAETIITGHPYHRP